MEIKKQKRKRIYSKDINMGQPGIADEIAFTSNCSSPNARKIVTITENFDVDIWVEKHYHIREQHGDNNGKREGIEPEKVQAIITESLKHLMFYSGVVKNFTFLNYKLPKGNRGLRVVCQKEYSGNMTNVIIEAHVVDLNCFEITVYTAIQKNDFEPSDGQYVIHLLGNKNSTLSYYTKRSKNLVEVSSI